MKKLLFLLLSGSLLFSCGSDNANSQKISQSTYNIVTFLDGGTMEKEPFINACMTSIVQGKNKDMYKNGGLDLCNCFLDKLTERYTLSEFKEIDRAVRERTESLEKTAYNYYKNPNFLQAIEECMEDPINFNADVKMEISSKEMLDLHILQCKDALKSALPFTEYNELLEYVYIDEYCACYMQKMTNEFTIKEMDNLEQRDNLIKLEKIQEDCILDNLR